MKPSPETLVDRLRGIYPSAVSQYKPSSINVEAADEIERLRVENRGLADLLQKKVDDYAELDVGTHREIERLEDEIRRLGGYIPMKPASEEDMKIYDEMAANYFKGKP